MLSEYLDGELPPATCAELDRHIRGCAPCVAFVESLRKSVRLCRGYLPEIEAPPLSEEGKHTLQDAYARLLAARRNE